MSNMLRRNSGPTHNSVLSSLHIAYVSQHQSEPVLFSVKCLSFDFLRESYRGVKKGGIEI